MARQGGVSSARIWGGGYPHISYLGTREGRGCPAAQEGQGALTAPSGRGDLGCLYRLWDPACPDLGIRGSPSLLSLQGGLKAGETNDREQG